MKNLLLAPLLVVALAAPAFAAEAPYMIAKPGRSGGAPTQGMDKSGQRGGAPDQGGMSRGGGTSGVVERSRARRTTSSKLNFGCVIGAEVEGGFACCARAPLAPVDNPSPASVATKVRRSRSVIAGRSGQQAIARLSRLMGFAGRGKRVAAATS